MKYCKHILKSMKNFEKQLLNHFQAEEQTNNNEPLKNVKNALGSIQFVKGNPLTKTEITLNIRSYYVQVGAPDQLIPPVLLPINLQNGLPVWIFSLTDYLGGFNKSSIIQPISRDWILTAGINIGVCGVNLPVNYPATTPTVNIPHERGDLIFSFDFGTPPTYRAYVVIHCENVAYGTFLNSFVSDLITINTLRCIVPIANVDQFINPLTFGYQSLFGKTYTDDIDPRNYITSKDFQQQIADIPINLPIDKAMMLSTHLNFDCQSLDLILFVEKVEPLTNRKL